MRYWGEDQDYLKGECENCGRILKIKTSCINKTEQGFTLNPSVRCFCNSIHETVFGHEQVARPAATTTHDQPIRCPKCTGTQLTAGNKGFGLGKELAAVYYWGQWVY